jgi:methylmalonyl-CoA/ethylmalonyl-CoA epimerase
MDSGMRASSRREPALYYQIVTSDRPIGFHHVAIALPRLADATGVLVGVLGGVPEASGPSREFSFGCWRYAGGGRIEALEPAGRDGFVHRFLAQRGPGIHHVTFKVPSLAAACARAEAHGYRVVGRDESRASWKEAFLHPKQALGIVVQLVESHRSPDPPLRLPLPPGPPVPPPPVTVAGLRLRAASRERAGRQWGDVLAGEARERDGTLVYRWPGSPMRIVVEIAPGGDEGPVAIELSSDRPVSLPGRPLGVTWTIGGER